MNVGSVAIGFIILLLSLNSSSELFSAWAWTLISGGLLLSIYQLENRKTLWNCRELVYIGNISFETFLIHQLIIRYGTWWAEYVGIQINFLTNIGFIFVAFIIAGTFYQIRIKKGK